MPRSCKRLAVDYFDGHGGQPHRMQMWIENGMLQLAGRDLIRQVPLPQVQWPEGARHGARMARIEDGAAICALDPGRWDAWRRENGLSASPAVRAQQSGRWSLVAAALLAVVTVMGYWWGLPIAMRAVAPLLSAQFERQAGETATGAHRARAPSPHCPGASGVQRRLSSTPSTKPAPAAQPTAFHGFSWT